MTTQTTTVRKTSNAYNIFMLVLARLLRGESKTRLIKDVVEHRSRYASFITILMAFLVLTIASILASLLVGTSASAEEGEASTEAPIPALEQELTAIKDELAVLRQMLEKMGTKDVGLLAEEIDPSTGDQIGNFPQAFSHLGLINSAINLAMAERQGADERPEMLAERLRKVRAALTEPSSPVRQKKRAS